MSFFNLSYPKKNIQKIYFSELKTLLKYSYNDRYFCSRRVYLLSEYSYYDSDISEIFFNNAIKENNKEVMLPYITIYAQFSDGNYFNTKFKIRLTYHLYCMNFWGNKKIMEALINESEIFSIHSESYCIPIFNSDKILFSIL